MATTTSTLTDKVYAVLAIDEIGRKPPVSVAGTYPCGDLSPFELDCRDWGFVYGVAFAIARGEDHWEPIEKTAERALTGARDAFARWAGSGIFTSQAFDADRAERQAEMAEAVAADVLRQDGDRQWANALESFADCLPDRRPVAREVAD
jgi:hypothetical protein